MKKDYLTNLPWENYKEIIGDIVIIFGVGLFLVVSLLVFEYGFDGFIQKFSELL